MSLNLPYSVVRGEQLALQANVFNYMKQDLSVSKITCNTKRYATAKAIKLQVLHMQQHVTGTGSNFLKDKMKCLLSTI